MKKQSVLILGARSDIGKAVAHQFASSGYPIQLAARQVNTLADDKTDIELRYRVSVTLHEFDALATETHNVFVDALPSLPVIAVCVVGLMGDQKQNEHHIVKAISVMRTNYEGPVSIFTDLANRFAERGFGTLVGVSSVAGERGRAANYFYGSAKAGFTTFLSGLRNRLYNQNVHVVTVLPGFVATQMTADMDFPVKLTAQPKEVAIAIEKAIRKRRNIIYVRPIWRFLMIVINNIPERLFKKMAI